MPRVGTLLVTGWMALAAGSSMAQTAAAPPAPMITAADLKLAAQPSMDQTWWKHAVVYEIYPRSFQDSNGDGVGDLNGITERLDYLQKLGVDAIWIAPMFPSPQVDFGYDVSDYRNVDPQYGSLADMDRLIAEAKKHNIRICLDWVLNHTSDKHAWFEESASSRTNPKADWYVWNDGKPLDANAPEYVKKAAHDGMMPPNNWESLFGGSAWTWVPARKQFYYHKFYVQQPDLNWSNPAVEKAMFDGMRFWMDRGIAGFRLDAVPTLFEDQQLRDEPVVSGVNKQGDPNLKEIYTSNLPEVHAVIRRMRAVADSYATTGFPGSRVLIGETYLPNTVELDKWYGGEARNELQLPMDMLIGFRNNSAKLDADYLRRYLTEVSTQVHGSQPLLVFDNHDNVRSHDRYGDGTHDAAIDRLIATVLFTSHATAMMYYGEELGMPTTPPTRVEDVKDPIGRTGWPAEKGRDGERTPMQWNATDRQAGFSTNSATWLPVPANYTTLNVVAEEKDPHSLLHWYERLIELRRKVEALHDGGVVFLDRSNPNVLSYVRTAPIGAKPVLVTMNMTNQAQTVSLDLAGAGFAGSKLHPLITDASSLEKQEHASGMTLPPYTSFVAEIE